MWYVVCTGGVCSVRAVMLCVRACVRYVWDTSSEVSLIGRDRNERANVIVGARDYLCPVFSLAVNVGKLNYR